MLKPARRHRSKQPDGPARILGSLATAVAVAACMSHPTGPENQPPDANLRVSADLGDVVISTLTGEITAPDLDDPLAFNMTIENGTAEATVTVPVGSDRRITIRAFDATGIETHRGSAIIDVVEGDNPSIAILLEPLVGDLPIEVTVQSLTVTITTPRETIAVGETVDLVVTIVDAGGEPITGPVRFATLQPFVATVNGDGRVTGVAPGEATIVATFSGVGAAIQIVVTEGLPALAWVPMEGLATDGNFSGVWGSAVDDLFVKGPAGLGEVSRWDGTSWTAFPIGAVVGTGNVWGLTPSDVYVVGGDFTGQNIVSRFDGNAFSLMPAYPQVSAFTAGIWGTASDDLYTVGDGGTILHYDGTTWSQMISPTSNLLEDVMGSSNSDIFAVGRLGSIVHYDGVAWSLMPHPLGTVWLASVWVAGPNDVFAVGHQGSILNYDGNAWNTMASGTTVNLHSVWGVSATNVIAVGDGGTILRYDGTDWTTLPSGVAEDLSGVWGASTTEWFVSSPDGFVLRSHAIASAGGR